MIFSLNKCLRSEDFYELYIYWNLKSWAFLIEVMSRPIVALFLT